MLKSMVVSALTALAVTSAVGAGAVQMVSDDSAPTPAVSDSPAAVQVAEVPVVEPVAEPTPTPTPTSTAAPVAAPPSSSSVSGAAPEADAPAPAPAPAAEAPQPATAPDKPACTSPTGCTSNGVPLPPPPAPGEGGGPASGDAGFNGPGVVGQP